LTDLFKIYGEHLKNISAEKRRRNCRDKHRQRNKKKMKYGEIFFIKINKQVNGKGERRVKLKSESESE